MGQQVGDAEHRIVLVLAHAEGHAGAVGTGKHAVDGQRHGAPLILADAAVVVGLKVAQVVGLIQGVRAQVQTGAVDVGNHQTEALLKGLLTDGSRHDGLVLLDEVDLLTGCIGLFRLKGLVTGSQQHLLAGGGSLAFGLGMVQEVLVALCKSGGLFLHVGLLVGSVFRLIEQLLCILLGRKFFTHG